MDLINYHVQCYIKYKNILRTGRREPIVFVSILILYFSVKWLISSKCHWHYFFKFGPMIQQVNYSQTASGPCVPIGGAIKHAQSLRDFPSTPKCLKMCIYALFLMGNKKASEPIRFAMINLAVLSKFGTTFKTLLLTNHKSNRLEICYRCVEYKFFIKGQIEK